MSVALGTQYVTRPPVPTFEAMQGLYGPNGTFHGVHTTGHPLAGEDVAEKMRILKELDQRASNIDQRLSSLQSFHVDTSIEAAIVRETHEPDLSVCIGIASR
jgi:hypothetical protein